MADRNLSERCLALDDFLRAREGIALRLQLARGRGRGGRAISGLHNRQAAAQPANDALLAKSDHSVE